MEYHFLTPDDRDGTMTIALTGEGVVVDLFIEGEFDTTWARSAQELADLIHALSWPPGLS